jgi:hypothetical protein
VTASKRQQRAQMKLALWNARAAFEKALASGDQRLVQRKHKVLNLLVRRFEEAFPACDDQPPRPFPERERMGVYDDGDDEL